MTLVLGPFAHARAPETPSPEQASLAFRQVERWVRTLEVEPSQDFQDPFHGASVTLRLGGIIIGRSSSIDLSSGGALTHASRLAINQARERLPLDRDALWEERSRALAGQIEIELELPGPLLPLQGETDADRALEVRYGLDGVAARLGDRAHAVYPGFMLTSETLPDAALGACRVALTGRGSEAVEPDRAAGAVYYRFAVVHMAQLDPGGAGIFLHRGGRVAPSFSGTDELRAYAGRLARHLMGRVVETEAGPGLGGTLDPILAEVDPPLAPAREQALAALALARFAGTGAGDAGVRARAADVARGLLEASAARQGGTPADPLAASVWLLASDALSHEGGAFEGECVRMVRGAFEGGEWAEEVPRAARALVVNAMAVTAEGDAERTRAREALTSVYKGIALGEMVSYMPWLGWAELALSEGGETVRARSALRELRRLVWMHQLTPRDVAPWDRDFVGGIVFSASRNVLPTWQSLRPLAFIATMLGDGRLTPAQELPTEIARLMRSMRFVRQLSAAEEEAHAYRDRRRALWGVRDSIWSRRMPPVATSLALLSVTETLDSLDGLSLSGGSE